jgi:DNA invertase Pin-like site-specific DNA recombinase
MTSELVTKNHLERRAIVYVRQSTTHQVINNQESLRLQYALRQRACDLGWRESDVDIIDADLGFSGTSAVQRAGFKELVGRVAIGEIGLILSIDVTRLARNCTDWYPLLDVCGHRSCLIADRDGVYDPGTTNGRLLLGLKGTISELELHTIRGRLTAGLMAKAGRGELAVMLPAGFTREPDGAVTKDPNREVQDAIELVFSSFLQIRSAAGVMRLMARRGLALPRHDHFHDTCWRTPTVSSVTAILKNPAYAGAFVYGRSCLNRSQTMGRCPQKSALPIPEWRIVVKGKYPAYINWETYLKIRAMLDDNRANYLRTNGRGIPRDGAALLHGITWCGECGRKMVVRYKRSSQYVCNQRRRQQHAPQCQCIYAAAIDAEVANAFLAAVAPAEIEAWTRARKAQKHADAALRRAEEQQVERLRYEARLAERQFNRVDPDNRLVADELERRWEVRLSELRRAEEAMVRNVSEESAIAIAPHLKAKVITLGQTLPQTWADPTISREHRKALLRCLIDKVVLRRTARDQVFVRIVWRGGATTELNVAVTVNAASVLPRFAEMEARVIELAHAGLDDHAIALTLTAEGHHSPKRCDKVLPSTVGGMRRRLEIKAIVRQTRWPNVDGYLTVANVAKQMNVSMNWLRGKIRRGAVQTMREPSGRYLFPNNPSTLEALVQLRARQIQRVDLTQHHFQNRGYHHG